MESKKPEQVFENENRQYVLILYIWEYIMFVFLPGKFHMYNCVLLALVFENIIIWISVLSVLNMLMQKLSNRIFIFKLYTFYKVLFPTLAFLRNIIM